MGDIYKKQCFRGPFSKFWITLLTCSKTCAKTSAQYYFIVSTTNLLFWGVYYLRRVNKVRNRDPPKKNSQMVIYATGIVIHVVSKLWKKHSINESKIGLVGGFNPFQKSNWMMLTNVKRHLERIHNFWPIARVICQKLRTPNPKKTHCNWKTHPRPYIQGSWKHAPSLRSSNNQDWNRETGCWMALNEQRQQPQQQQQQQQQQQAATATATATATAATTTTTTTSTTTTTTTTHPAKSLSVHLISIFSGPSDRPNKTG